MSSGNWGAGFIYEVRFSCGDYDFYEVSAKSQSRMVMTLKF